MAPIKTVQVRTKYAPWMSDTTKQKIISRNAAQKKASETGAQDDWANYRSIRNSVNSTLRKEKEILQTEKLGKY